MKNILKALRQTRAALDTLAFAGIPTQQAQTFLTMAEFYRMPQQDLQHSAGVSQATLSRHLNTLRDELGLVESYDDPTDRRAKLVELTDAGIDVVVELEYAMRPAPRQRHHHQGA
jgi:DNA-binding MarR family transcriptional regulator